MYHQVRRYQRSPKCHLLRQLQDLNAVATTTTKSDGEPIHGNEAHLDTDSAKIGVDNRCSACISHDINEFQGPVQKVTRSINGFGGERTINVYQGEIIWEWCNTEGIVNRFIITNSYYVPAGKCRLLSPQHWKIIRW